MNATLNCSAKGCMWLRDDDIYHTGCGRDWMFTDGDTVADIGAKFCIYCGGNIIEVIVPMKITVNGEEHHVESTNLQYDEVVKLAGYGSGRVLSVTYHGARKGDSRRSGIMHPGCMPVDIEEGMRFAVADTSNA